MRTPTFRPSRLAMLAVAFAITCLNIAQAAVILVDENRQVRSNGSVSSTTSLETWSVEERSPGNFGDFNFVVDETRNAGSNISSSMASLRSSITEGLFSAAGESNSVVELNEARGNSSVNGNGSSRFEVTFQVTEPTFFSLDGFLTFEQLLGSPRGSATIKLSDGSFSGRNFQLSFGSSSAFGDFSQVVSISGLLEPNTYTLRAFASSSADAFSINSTLDGRASFDVNLALRSATVPLPAAAWMFGLALSMLAAFRSRRQVAG